jgi:SAM-dependent methyltransferase
MSGEFKDHFSSQAASYAVYRPAYPPALFIWLAGLVPEHRLAWDCATGNGQSAVMLAEHFEQVIATDASAAQIDSARPTARVSYRVAPAEASGLGDATVDLVTVSQALHWFDLARFWPEVERVAKPAGVVAAWGYNSNRRISPAIDGILERFESETVGPYWPPDRALVDDAYRGLPFPFEEIAAPPFEMTAVWDLDHLVGYLGTWSATQQFRKAAGTDPLPALRAELAGPWGDPARKRRVSWPLFFRVGRVSGGGSPRSGRS